MRRLVMPVFMLLAAMVAGLGGAALADDVFPDVADSSPFHDEISAFAGAGCADGFPDGGFHPTEAVKRQQMARFFSRCGGRAMSTTSASQSNTSGTFVDAAAVSFTPPADGFVVITGSITATVPAANLSACTCQADARIEVGGISFTPLSGDVSGVPGGDGNAQTNITVTRHLGVSAGVEVTLSVEGRFVDANLAQMLFDGALLVCGLRPVPGLAGSARSPLPPRRRGRPAVRARGGTLARTVRTHRVCRGQAVSPT